MSNYRDILKRYWGYDDFRGIQRDIIESIGLGRDTLGLMPTGGGKSITFQVPALAMEGVCIVVTPLIALMKDQVHHLRQIGIQAAAIYSGMQHDEILRVLENCILGSTKLLYVSPERLSSQLFQTKLRHMRVSFITVDEAHCISQWGYDFRPSYLEIATIRHLLPGIPVLALTATATPQVVDDICAKLTPQPSAIGHQPSAPSHQPSAIGRQPSAPSHQFAVFRMSFERKNLAYIVRNTSDKHYELIHILEQQQGSAIVYVRSRRHAREIAEHLSKAGLSATFYHAGLDYADKDNRQRDWQHDRVRIMVATNAFGMGIDKPDVRVVVHYDCPDSLEAYFQEAGRAGRDAEFQGIDFSGIIEDLEPDFDDFTKLSYFTFPATLFVGGIVCVLLGVGIRDRLAFYGIESFFITVSVIGGWAFLWKKKRVDAKKQILEVIQKYEERARVFK